MSEISKKDVRNIAKHTNWQKKDIALFLNQYVYPSKKDWINFSTLTSLTLGIGLFAIGVVFFFAYNWQAIPSYGKLSIILVLIGIFSLISIHPKIQILYKQLCLTAVSLMVGVLFAVFGQIYQTGANAYDFFLAWSIFCLIWVITARFKPLWVLYFCLLNTTLFFYYDQVLEFTIDKKNIFAAFILLNVIPILFEFIRSKAKKTNSSSYLSYAFSAVSLTFTTAILCYSIADSDTVAFGDFIALLNIVLVTYTAFYYKRTYYLALLSLVLLAIVTTLFFKIFDFSEGTLLLISFMIILYITAATLTIINLKNKWK